MLEDFFFGDILLKIKDLLHEATAAEKAHSLGYTSAGYDKWEKDGKIVARTVNGQLVPVDQTATTNDEPAPKPTTMSAKDAGTKPSNTVMPSDAAKAAGNSSPEKSTGKAAEAPEPHTAPRNPYGLKPFSIGRAVEDYEIAEEIAETSDPYGFTKTLNADEEVFMVSEGEYNRFLNAYDDDIDVQAMHKMGKEIAIRQNRNWRQKLDPIIKDELMKVQLEWQEEGQFSATSDVKAHRNAFINLIAAGRPQAVLEGVQYPIERGMVLKLDECEDILKEFTVGEDVDMPPSGFSFSPVIARGFAQSAASMIGMVIRLAPNRQGQLNGISLSEVYDPNDSISKVEMHQTFNSEQEVIRPSGPKARCVAIRKMIQQPGWNSMSNSVKVCYIIELEERGYDPDKLEELKRSMKKKKEINPIFEKIMNTSFGFWRNKNRSLLEHKLRRLISILEGKASDQAHKLGLKYKGHGYWGDASGKTVAKTVDDQLVKATEKDHANTPLNPNDTWEDDAFTPAFGTPWHTKKKVPYTGADTKGMADNILFKIEGDQKGSNPGGIFKGKDGIRRYVKFYHDEAQAYGEVLANHLYHDLGIAAPESQYFDNAGKTAFASVLVPNKGTLQGKLYSETAAQIMDGFAADCLMANWDVIGLAQDNIVLSPTGNPIRIDNGGSFLMRAQAGRKPKEALNICPEIDIFPKAQYQPIFKTLGLTSAEQIKASLRKQVSNILDLVQKYNGWENYVEEKIPDMPDADKQEIISMLYHRTSLLINFVQ